MLTVLGISVGIGAILFLVSLGSGLQHILISEIAASMLSMDIKVDSSALIKLDKDQIEKIKSINGVAEVSPVFKISSMMRVDELSGAISAILVKPPFFSMEGLKVANGVFFTGDSDNKIVVSTATLQLFNLSADNTLGKTVRFELFMPKIDEKNGNLVNSEEVETVRLEKTYEIVGIVDDSSESYIYMPMDSVENLKIPFYTQLKLTAKDQKDIPEIKTQIEIIGFVPTALSDTISDADRIFQAIQIILSVFGAVALVVSAIGMFNTMTIALLERTQEIGIMKALGASRHDIWKLFLAESVIIGFLGGAVGIILGFSGTYAVNAGVNVLAKNFGGQQVSLFYTSNSFVFFIIIFSTIVGFVTGLYPSRRASRLNPLEALRYK
ncbi:ABC transporter permease [Patescibacteria group bacterium]|nr:ABC transporter permease [Patescibacteria group bacterium]MBU4579848.1 ABC transporter permease [Patescibacteria group bacterium]